MMLPCHIEPSLVATHTIRLAIRLAIRLVIVGSNIECKMHMLLVYVTTSAVGSNICVVSCITLFITL